MKSDKERAEQEELLKWFFLFMASLIVFNFLVMMHIAMTS